MSRTPHDAESKRDAASKEAASLPQGSLAHGLMEEARVAAASGHRELARRRFESALYLLRSREQAPEAATIFRNIGHLYFEDGEFSAGEDCLEVARAVAEATGDASALARTTNALAGGYWLRGRLDDAQRLYTQAGVEAREVGDVKLAAMVEQNLGTIANVRGDLTAAIAHYQTSLSGYRELGLDDQLGNVLNNVGMAHARLGQWQDAERTYLEALAMCAACGDVRTSLMIEVNRAETLIARGRLADAKVISERVLRRAQPLNDLRAISETQKNLGIVARDSGSFDVAEGFLREAFSSATTREDLLLAAEVAREQAELYSAMRRERETLQALNTSHRLFGQLRAQRDIADVTRRMRGLEQRFYDIVSAWARSIESKDPYTLGHCERVADYACAIFRAVDPNEGALFWFRIGALLHDVGKINVPTDVLNKPGKLTPEERALMESHPVAGVELLKDVEFPWDVLPMVRSHHERWDGKGYPDRLTGEEIPLHARVLALADVFDALTTDRPYRPAFSPEEALRMMRVDMVGAFDPSLFPIFERLVPSFQGFAAAAGRRPEVKQAAA
ncbi:MAG TPA: HD domain-containing phosphohydrolase [Gemmatimonadaceae bacterium]|nr:HD domain-containing phosphohydrolase [Gemmatimonadaceae bacterium]